jgi:hypothetical protein
MCNKKKKIDEPCACGETCGVNIKPLTVGLSEESLAWLEIQRKKMEWVKSQVGINEPFEVEEKGATEQSYIQEEQNRIYLENLEIEKGFEEYVQKMDRNEYLG